jgi:hypothetical protein
MTSSRQESQAVRDTSFAKSTEAAEPEPDQLRTAGTGETTVEPSVDFTEGELIQDDGTPGSLTDIDGDLGSAVPDAGGSIRGAFDDLDAGTSGSSLFDDVGGAVDTEGIFDDLNTGGGPGDFADQSSQVMDGGPPAGYSQWGEHEYSYESSPTGESWTHAYGEPDFADDGEAVQAAHGNAQPTGDDRPDGPASGEWGNILEEEERHQGDDPNPDENPFPPQDEMGGQGDPDPGDEEDQYEEEAQHDEQDDEGSQDHAVQHGSEGNQTPAPADDFGHGGLDGSRGGAGDPDPDLEAAGDAGGLKAGAGDTDPDPDLADAGGAGALDHQLLGAVDPAESMVDGPMEGSDLAEALGSAEDFADTDIEFDDSVLDLDVEADAVG